MQKTRRSGPEPILLPEAAVGQIICDARREWMSMDEQKKSLDELVNRLGTRDKAKRTMTSRFRTMLNN